MRVLSPLDKDAPGKYSYRMESTGRSAMTTTDTSLYLGDNGMCLCGQHLGYTAKTTGRDLSGQPILKVTPNDLADEGIDGLACEIPSCNVTVKASRIILPA